MQSVITQPPATVAANTNETAVAVSISPLKEVITPALIKPGCKKTLIAQRIAAGCDKKVALAEFDAALASHREANKASLAALASLASVSVRTLAKTKTGWRATLHDDREQQAKATAKAAAKLEALRAKVAALEAKLSA